MEKYYFVYEKYEKEQNLAKKKIFEISSTYYPILEQSFSFLGELDALYSLAMTAVNSEIPFTRPTIFGT